MAVASLQVAAASAGIKPLEEIHKLINSYNV
jgi:hypothetical protein